MSEGNDTFSEHAHAADAADAATPKLEVDLQSLSSVTLARLVEEVKSDDLPSATRYDRTYNRHNR